MTYIITDLAAAPSTRERLFFVYVYVGNTAVQHQHFDLVVPELLQDRAAQQAAVLAIPVVFQVGDVEAEAVRPGTRQALKFRQLLDDRGDSRPLRHLVPASPDQHQKNPHRHQRQADPTVGQCGGLADQGIELTSAAGRTWRGR